MNFLFDCNIQCVGHRVEESYASIYELLVKRMREKAVRTLPPQLMVFVVGEKGVGKTAVMKRFCCKTGSSMMAKNTLGARLTEDSQQTIFLCHETPIRYFPGGHFLRRAQGLVFMFDLTNRASFTVLREHIIDVTRGQYRYLSCVLIGNKSDDVEHRQVLLPEISEFAGMYNIDYFETSAKLYTNIDEAFITLGRNSLRQYGVLTEKKKESTVSSWCAVS